jgi:GGDEF domain-containing protein
VVVGGSPEERALRAVGPADALHHASEHDPLTGLLNAVGVARRVEASTRDAGAVVVAGLEAGHGPAVVAIVARRFAGVVRPTDVIGRLNETDFVVYLPGADVYAATIVGGRLLDVLDEVIDVDGAQVRPTLSVGIDASTARPFDDQLVAATVAMTRSADAGGGRVEVAR